MLGRVASVHWFAMASAMPWNVVDRVLCASPRQLLTLSTNVLYRFPSHTLCGSTIFVGYSFGRFFSHRHVAFD